MDNDISPPPSKKRRVEAGNDVRSESPSPSRHLRIYSWNVNGIAPFIQPSIGDYLKKKSLPLAATTNGVEVKANNVAIEPPITTSLRNFLRRHHWPQILHLQEVKINPSDTATQRAVETAVNRCRSGADGGPHYSVRFCLPRDKFNARGSGRKVYGVASIIRTDFLTEEVSRVREVDWDVEGRVIIIETHSRLSLWNIYAVNGTTNAYKDPVTGEIAGTRHDRKLAFHNAMLTECQNLEHQGFQLVLAGDLNVASQGIDGHPRLRIRPEAHVYHRADFNAKFLDEENVEGLRLVDSFRYLHPKQKKYTWMNRNLGWRESCDRVDYFLLSRGLLDTNEQVLVAADILMTSTDRGTSDHFPLWIQLDLSRPTNLET